MVEQEEDPVAVVIAGFIVWLATHGFDSGYRQRCPVVAGRFLRWQRRRRRQGLPCDVTAYCRELTIEGIGQNELTSIREVVRDLVKFGDRTGALDELGRVSGVGVTSGDTRDGGSSMSRPVTG